MQQVRLRSRKGQSLIEAMIAISLLVIGFMGTITLINRSIGLNRVVADTYTATYLAAEGVEVIKSLIDGNFIAERGFFEGFALCTATCEWEVAYDSNWEDLQKRPQPFEERPLWYNQENNTFSYTPFGTQTNFTRKIRVTLQGESGNELVVESFVEWRTRGGGKSAVRLEDHFYNWYILPTEEPQPTP